MNIDNNVEIIYPNPIEPIDSIQEEKFNNYLINYSNNWTDFKEEVKKFLSQTTFNLTNLNKLSSIGTVFSFIEEALEKKFFYNSALIQIYNNNFKINNSSDWPDTQINNICTFSKIEEQNILLTTIPIYLKFPLDYQKEIVLVKEVKFVINNKFIAKRIPNDLNNELISFFGITHNFESLTFPNENRWDDARILDVLELIYQSLQKTFINIYINKINVRFAYDKVLEKEYLKHSEINTLFSKSSLLSKIHNFEIIYFPIKIIYDGEIVLETKLMIEEIIFTKKIQWDKKWEFPYNIK